MVDKNTNNKSLLRGKKMVISITSPTRSHHYFHFTDRVNFVGKYT